MKYLIGPVFGVLISILLSQCSKLNQEEVTIVDQAFLEALIGQGIDRNNNGSISLKEAERAEAIHLWPSNIHDLKGIEAFVNLDTLSVQLNPLSNLDLSMNKSLRYLELIGCEQESLDVSELIDLRYLDCSGSLAMKSFLTELDISQNYYLEKLICEENQLQSLNISQNTNLLKVGFDNMPMLLKVCVWKLPFPPPGIAVLMGFSPNVVFYTNCGS